MRNLKVEIEYEGTKYCGWQVQKSPQSTGHSRHKKSIQETIERALQKILQEKIRVIGSGRTDAGVHALCQVVNFKTNSTNLSLTKLQKALNALLPDDIVIKRIEEVSPKFNSRFDVKSKVYRYAILNRAYPCAFLRNRVYFYPYPLNIKLMRDESKYLLGKHNFKSFQASGSTVKNTIRTIKSLRITTPEDLIYIDIEADGFLYNMARNVVGTLIEIGKGVIKKGGLKKILKACDRRLAGHTAAARGLCLMKVNYEM